MAAIRQKLKAVATDDDSDGELKPPQKPLSPSMSNAEQAVEVVEPGLSMDLPGKEDSPPPTDSQNLNNDLPDVVLAKYPAPSEPNWAKPELVEFCDSDEESD